MTSSVVAQLELFPWRCRRGFSHGWLSWPWACSPCEAAKCPILCRFVRARRSTQTGRTQSSKGAKVEFSHDQEASLDHASSWPCRAYRNSWCSLASSTLSLNVSFCSDAKSSLLSSRSSSCQSFICTYRPARAITGLSFRRLDHHFPLLWHPFGFWKSTHLSFVTHTL